MRPLDFLWVGLGGATGAMLRALVSLAGARWVPEATHWATFGVNVLGCLGLGALLGWSDVHDPPSAGTRSFLVVGLLGSFTTFSTFSWEAHDLWRGGSPLGALGYGAASLVAGLVAVWVGASWVRG